MEGNQSPAHRGWCPQPAENKSTWALQAEPGQSERASTTATLLFNIHILFILMLGGKSILPANEKAVFVFTNSTLILGTRLPDTLPLAAAVGSNPSPPREAAVGAGTGGKRWLTGGWEPVPAKWGHAVNSVNRMRELKLVGESSQPGTGELDLRISQVRWFETYRKSRKIRGPLISHLLLCYFFPHAGSFLDYWLWNTTFTIALTRSSWTSEVWHSA